MDSLLESFKDLHARKQAMLNMAAEAYSRDAKKIISYFQECDFTTTVRVGRMENVDVNNNDLPDRVYVGLEWRRGQLNYLIDYDEIEAKPFLGCSREERCHVGPLLPELVEKAKSILQEEIDSYEKH